MTRHILSFDPKMIHAISVGEYLFLFCFISVRENHSEEDYLQSTTGQKVGSICISRCLGNIDFGPHGRRQIQSNERQSHQDPEECNENESATGVGLSWSFGENTMTGGLR